MRRDQRSQEEIVEEFARYVSPSKVETYRQMGFTLVPGRREGPRIPDGDRALMSRRSR